MRAKNTNRQRMKTSVAVAHTVIWCACIAVVFAMQTGTRTDNVAIYRADTASLDIETVKKQSSDHSPLNYHAVVIGISDYASHRANGWESLRTARGDAEAVADLLEEKYGFEVTRLFDREASRDAIIAALDDLVGLDEDDAVLIYYAGHGFYEESLSEGYWIPADAKKTTGSRYAKSDWIWNSTITKLISAAQARHVLVVADSCFSGSMFRGGQGKSLDDDFHWYNRAINKPSRYLITSGDLEPVLDDGGQHSIFAQEFLNFLNYTDKPVFSASDIGIALREKVSTLTGQLVRMGPIAVSTHAGGEFVFITEDTQLDWQNVQPVEVVGLKRGRDVPGLADVTPALDRQSLLQDAVLMSRQGASKSADRLVSTLTEQDSSDQLVLAVASHMSKERRAKKRDQLRGLISQLEEQKAQHRGNAGSQYEDFAHPRIIACIGPVSPSGDVDGESMAILSRIALLANLDQGGVLQVVERDALEDILTEMSIRMSELADKRVRSEVGKLLPASLLLVGDVMKRADGQDIYLKLIDTETSRILGSFNGEIRPGKNLADVCADLSSQIIAKARQLKPLTARVLDEEADSIHAGIGSFHGANESMSFVLVERVPMDPAHPDEDYRTVELGTATIASLGEQRSALIPNWTSSDKRTKGASIWVQEKVE